MELHSGVVADSLVSVQTNDLHSLEVMVDSVGLIGSAEVVPSAEVVQITPTEMFGEQSQLVTVTHSEVVEQSIVSDALFQSLALVALFLVIFFIARHRRRIGVMFGRMFKGRLPEDFSSGRRDEVITRSFLQSSTIIGVLLLVLFAVKYVPLWMPESFMPDAEKWRTTVAMVYVLLAFVVITLYEHSLLFVIGKVAQSDSVVGAIRYLKRTLFSLASIALSPLFLLGILAADQFVGVWTIMLASGCAVFVFLFLKETLVFFIDKKIPIFLWILYLCAVEAFPLSLIWALVVRN